MTNLNSITKNDEAWAVNEFNIIPKLYLDEYTRETATQLAIATLVKRQETISIEKIDDLCFISYDFPISHRKGSPAKNTGGLSVKKRIDRYTYNNKHIDYNLDLNSFTIDQDILDRVKSLEKFKTRKQFVFKTLEKIKTRSSKCIALGKQKHLISDMLFNHLAVAGKQVY